MDTRKILSKIVEAGYTQQTLAMATGIKLPALNRKIHNKVKLTANDIKMILDTLNNIKDCEIYDIFLK